MRGVEQGATTGERVTGSTPAMSVVIAAYNAEATLAAQLAALTRQRTSFEWEVLLCDNGSTDETVEIARAWAGVLPQLVIVDASARRGPGAARNVGVAHARGELLVFCDADDVIADDWLEQMHRGLTDAPFVASRIEHRRLNAGFPEEFRAAEGMMYPTPPLPQYPMVGSGHMGVRKAAFDAIGGFDEDMRTAEDLDLSWRLQLAGFDLAANPAALVHVRHRATLRGVYRQAYGYGSNHRRLMHKYALVFSTHPPGEPPPGADGVEPVHQPPVDATGSESEPRGHAAGARAHPFSPSRRIERIVHRVGRLPRKVARVLRHPLELAPIARRLGLSIGRLMSRADPTAPQLRSDGSDARLGQG